MGAAIIGMFIHNTIIGMIVGAIPAIIGAVKQKFALGISGLITCVGGSMLLGLFLSIPICIIFIYLLFKKPKHSDNDTDKA